MRHRWLLLLGILTALSIFLACGSATGPTESTAGPTESTASPTESRPWKVVYASDDPRSFMLPGNLLVGVDFGREISREEQNEFKDKARITDGKGKGYECMGSMTGSSMTVTRGGKTYAFGPTMFFAFSVESGVPEYSFILEDWSPVDLGNPFSQPIYSP